METKEVRISDPTTLTTQQILREVETLKELLTQRIDAVDQAVERWREDMVRFPTEVDKAVNNIKDLMYEKINTEHLLKEEKFGKVEQRFNLVEAQRVEQKKDTATAVDTALRSAKEAIDDQNKASAIAISKSEVAVAKQMDQLGVLIDRQTKSTEDKITDMKERLVKMESALVGFEWIRAEVANLKTGSTTLLGKNLGTKDSMGWILFAVTILGFLINYIMKLPK